VITVKSGVTLYLRNITLAGIGDNTAPLITVVAGRTLVLEDGAAVEGNTNTNTNTSYGGGVNNAGAFIMEGGEISGNTAVYIGGGGVYNAGTFTMKAGEISGNTADLPSSTSYNSGRGGGVYNRGAGSFTMKGGKISDNNARTSGGGVYMAGVSTAPGSFTMEAGEISGNTSDIGGGVYNYNAGIFTMKGGKISDNNARVSGGGVLNSGTLTMEGGEISGNTAITIGGGIYLACAINGTLIFTKTGGTIYGDTDTTHTPGSTENTASNGHAVFISLTLDTTTKSDDTVGPEVRLYAKCKATGIMIYDWNYVDPSNGIDYSSFWP
jgi:hypothetical protein